jgi:hypothetical protein
VGSFCLKGDPTRGLKERLKAVSRRLSGQCGEVDSAFRLDTRYSSS